MAAGQGIRGSVVSAAAPPRCRPAPGSAGERDEDEDGRWCDWTEGAEAGHGQIEESDRGAISGVVPAMMGDRRDRGSATAAPRRDAGTVRRWVVGFLVSGGILASLFVTQDTDPRALGPLVRAVSLPGVAAFVGVSLVALLLGSGRYWILLERRARLWPPMLVTLVRNLFVHLVPARAGAAASYLYLVTTRLRLPVEAAVASMGLAFVLDTLALVPLLLLAILLMGVVPLSPGLLGGGSLLLLAGSVGALVLLAPALSTAARAAERLPGRLARAAGPLAGAAVEVRRLATVRVLAPAFGLSVLVRLAKYGAYDALLEALVVGQGHAWGNLNVLRAFLSVAGAELALPVPTVASVGPYEAAGALGFTYWLGLPLGQATLAVTAFHGLSQVYDNGLGLLALLWITARWAGRRSEAAGR